MCSYLEINNGVIISYDNSNPNVVIPSGIIKIGKHAFQGSNVETVTFEDTSLSSIGEEAFEGCESLRYIELPESVVQIESYAFRGCTSLEYITIPKSSILLGEGIFRSCNNMMVVIGDENSEIQKYLYAISSGDRFITDKESFLENYKGKIDAINNLKKYTVQLGTETLTCSNNLLLFESIINYYSSRRDIFFNKYFNEFPHKLGKENKQYDFRKTIENEAKNTVTRLFDKGIVASCEQVLAVGLDEYNKLYDATKAITDVYAKVGKALVDNVTIKQNEIYANAQSKVVGLSYGVIGDWLTCATYIIDDEIQRYKQSVRANAEAAAETKKYYSDSLTNANKTYLNFLESSQSHLKNGTDALINKLCDAEIQFLERGCYLVKDEIDSFDASKSFELLQTAMSATNKEIPIALSLIKYPLNINTIVYSLENNIFVKEITELTKFLGLSKKVEEILSKHHKSQNIVDYVSPYKELIQNQYNTLKQDDCEKTKSKILGYHIAYINDLIDPKVLDCVDLDDFIEDFDNTKNRFSKELLIAEEYDKYLGQYPLLQEKHATEIALEQIKQEIDATEQSLKHTSNFWFCFCATIGWIAITVYGFFDGQSVLGITGIFCSLILFIGCLLSTNKTNKKQAKKASKELHEKENELREKIYSIQRLPRYNRQTEIDHIFNKYRCYEKSSETNILPSLPHDDSLSISVKTPSVDNPQSTISKDAWMDEIENDIIRGDKIQAIKKYRDHTNCSLKEAKDYIDAISK